MSYKEPRHCFHVITSYIKHPEIQISGNRVGRVNSLAIVVDPNSDTSYGCIIPIEAQVTNEKYANIAFKQKSLLQKIFGKKSQFPDLIKKFTGIDISKKGLHVKFIGADGVNGDGASVAIITSVISDLLNIPIHQNLALTGALSVHGEVLPVNEVNTMIEGAAKAGINTILIPEHNREDVVIDDEIIGGITIIPVQTLDEVLSLALIKWNLPKK